MSGSKKSNSEQEWHLLDRWRADKQVADSDRYMRIWILRILVRLGRFRGLHSRRHRRIDFDDCVEILQGIGLDLEADESFEKIEPILPLLKKILVREETKPVLAASSSLSRNIDRLGKTLSLSETEKVLLHFFVQMTTNEPLQAAASMVGKMNDKKLSYALSVILNLPQRDLAKSIAVQAPLSRSGIVDISTRKHVPGAFDLDDLEVSSSFADKLLLSHQSDQDLLNTLLPRTAVPTLTEDDFSHLGKEYCLIRDYLHKARRHNLQGVNILVYGQPGTGKTEMVRVLCAKLGLHLYEVPIEDEDGEPIHGKSRIRSCSLAQHLLAKRPDAILLFDEIEDAFPGSFSMGSLFTIIASNSRRELKKAWTNHLLENNQTPTFWLSNRVGQMDPAFIRRFDLVFQLHPPGPGVRRRILDRMLDGLAASEPWRERMAANPNLMPAHIERAAKVVKTLFDHREQGKRTKQKKVSASANKLDSPSGDTETALETLFINTLEAQGYPPKPPRPAPALTEYDPAILNADTDLGTLAQGLADNPQGRLCFYGPPGTGKTAFAHHLARSIGSPIIVRQMADLLDCYVGMTEKLIAAMFREAERERAVLLLDEADGLLGDRSGATRSWEVTQTNQILTSMENFEGVFIASTNLMNHLDQACLRRFDFKIKFSYLTPPQAWKMFQQALKAHDLKGRAKESRSLKQRLNRLDKLTPGDFNTVLRKQRLLGGFTRPQTLLEALEKEVELKPGHNKAIGFVS